MHTVVVQIGGVPIAICRTRIGLAGWLSGLLDLSQEEREGGREGGRGEGGQLTAGECEFRKNGLTPPTTTTGGGGVG